MGILMQAYRKLRSSRLISAIQRNAVIKFSQYIASPLLIFLMLISILGGFVVLIRLGYAFLDPNVPPKDLLEELRISLISLGASLGVPFIVWRTIVLSINSKISERTHQANLYFQATQKLGEMRKESLPNLPTEKTRSAGKQVSGSNEYNFPDIEVRVGSIFALHSLLQISDEYYWPSIQTLSTYVELNESKPIDYISKDDMIRLILLEKSGQSRIFCEEYIKLSEAGSNVRQAISKPRADVQAALSVLTSKAPPYFGGSMRHIRPVLAGRNLQNADLRGANFTSASLQYVSAQGADLRFAILDHCNLYRARFDAARMRGISLIGANLAGAVFAQLDIRGDEAGFQAQLERAFGDVWTVLPSGVERPSHWVSETLDWRDLHDSYHAWSTKSGRLLTARY